MNTHGPHGKVPFQKVIKPPFGGESGKENACIDMLLDLCFLLKNSTDSSSQRGLFKRKQVGCGDAPFRPLGGTI